MKICTNCHHIGQGQRKNFLEGNIYIGIVYLLLGAYVLMTTDFSGLNIIKFFIGLYFAIMGILKFIEYERGGKVCPKCNHERMIESDNPEAQALIKAHNLSIPDDELQPSSPKTSQ